MDTDRALTLNGDHRAKRQALDQRGILNLDREGGRAFTRPTERIARLRLDAQIGVIGLTGRDRENFTDGLELEHGAMPFAGFPRYGGQWPPGG